MKIRYLIAAVVALLPVLLVVGMNIFSGHMAEQEQVWNAQKLKLGQGQEFSVKLAKLWLFYWIEWWWVIGPGAIAAGLVLAMVIVRNARQSLHNGRSP